MSAALPAVAVITGEVRALTVYDACPADCGAVLVPDDAFAPHLRAGELAIVDPDDNDPQHGEIYVVTISSPREPDGIKLDIVQLRAKAGWWMHFSTIRSRPELVRTWGSHPNCLYATAP